MPRRTTNVFSLSFLDAMTCGFGAVVLFFMVINASVGTRADRVTGDLKAEVDRLETEVLEGHRDLVELRNSLREIDQQDAEARGLSRQAIENIEDLQVELATYENTTLAQEEHVNRLMADLKSLEESNRRLSAAIPEAEEPPGDRLRSHIGDGDRQYLTGLKVGGQRILILVDASASMLDETIVNIIRRRNLPDSRKIQSKKWRQAVATVDWVTTQIPTNSRFQIYTFDEAASSVVPDSDGQWLDGGDKEVLDDAVDRLSRVVPARGTNLYRAFLAISNLSPAPDNVILLVDGLPTQGKASPRSRTISARERQKLFNKAVDELPRGFPVNVILFPMEGDPRAPSAFWQLAMATRGSFLNPSKDWP
jgi:hypothetical protein